MDEETLEQQRLQLESTGLDRQYLDDNPFEQFRRWFDFAQQHSPGNWYESNAMTVATSDLAGNVSARTVLLKEFDADGFIFFTNYASQKGDQLAANPNAAILFHWPHLARQIRIEGSVDKVDRASSEQYFHSRPRGSQISAAISGQSQPVPNREHLEQAAAMLEAKLDGGEVPLPETWGGYLVRPRRFEFWQGRTSRLHDRFRYELIDGAWRVERLSP